MIKTAPQPLKFDDNSATQSAATQAIASRIVQASVSVNSAVKAQHLIQDEHKALSLRELQALSRSLREQIRPLQEQQKSVDEMIAVRHQELRNMKQLAELSPEDFDDVVSGRAQLMQDVAIDKAIDAEVELNEHDHTVQ